MATRVEWSPPSVRNTVALLAKLTHVAWTRVTLLHCYLAYGSRAASTRRAVFVAASAAADLSGDSVELSSKAPRTSKPNAKRSSSKFPGCDTTPLWLVTECMLLAGALLVKVFDDIERVEADISACERQIGVCVNEVAQNMAAQRKLHNVVGAAGASRELSAAEAAELDYLRANEAKLRRNLERLRTNLEQLRYKEERLHSDKKELLESTWNNCARAVSSSASLC